MRHIIHRHKTLWSDKVFFNLAFDSILLFAASMVINFLAGTYASSKVSNSVNDLFLDNFPTFDVSLIFIDGFIFFVAFVIVLLVHEPKRIPFTLKTVALFVLVRSIFMTLTHIGLPPNQLYLETGDIVEKFIFTGDLFFSGHTGLPYLMALIFWHTPRLRNIFFAVSLVFGISVLLGHIHYSIDVFAAYFITYGIYKISKDLFKKDRKIFLSPLPLINSAQGK